MLLRFLLLVAASAANPIRKVVTLLQNMKEKVEHEGEVEADLFEKFQCRCREDLQTAQKGLTEAQQRLPALRQAVEKTAAELQRLSLEADSAKAERAEAEESLAEARAMRRKEAAVFQKASKEQRKAIDSLDQAVVALTKGMAESFLQTDAAAVLRSFALEEGLMETERQDLLAFLQNHGGAGYVPQSGEVLGMLKHMASGTRQSLAEAQDVEAKAQQEFADLSVAKTKEVKALTASIEEKIDRVGELKVALVRFKSDVDDAETAEEDQQKVLQSLKSSCSKKASAWEVKVQHRNEELQAIGETIGVLNNDDALESFKKALPTSLLQVDSAATLQAQMRHTLQQVSPEKADLILMALRGKKIGFEKVIQMIDSMKSTMKKEQENEDAKKKYCKQQFTSADDKKKDLMLKVSNKEANIDSAKDALKITEGEIQVLGEAVVRLDADVAGATEQRKKEHQEFVQVMSDNEAARGLLEVAKKRLKQFYTAPSLLEVVEQRAEGPESPYKKSPQGLGVLVLLERLIRDTELQMSEAKAEEKQEQEDYEEIMQESSKKRENDSRSIMKKTAQKADLVADLQTLKQGQRISQKELEATEGYIKNLHGECDWLLANFEARADAREEELASLDRSKAVLSGADFSFLQVRRRHFLAP